MIIYETYNATLTRAYSDAGMLIERDGIRYEEAVDPTVYGRTYTETDIPIDPGDASDEATLADYREAAQILGLEG